MKTSESFVRGLAGGFVALFMYGVCSSLYMKAAIATWPLLVNSLLFSVGFAVIFAAVNFRQQPTLVRSTVAGALFVGGTVLLSMQAGTFAGWSVPSVAALVILAAMLAVVSQAAACFKP